jgi:RHH-type proline utilization regulon transcriptional repressor/proline dehydrogenase/delta 1-pyrroline-5-carboxylate dehydrogenase
LSALHPRYEFAQTARVIRELYPIVEQLVAEARTAGIGVTLDAEEADRLELSLLLVDKLLTSEATRGYAGFGLAVQAYQKRAYSTIEWLIGRLKATDRRITLRLVKGAYWDSEIKRAQERGLVGYPVFTRKPNTDVSYLACAKLLESAGERIYPQFATHNAHTIAHVAEVFGGDANRFEFQRLHGMGAELYDSVVRGPWGRFPCRVYAPVGAHEDLLPYLVRRLLENGANTSFVNRIVDASLPAEEVVADPIAEVDALERVAHPRIPLPVNLFAPERLNSAGFNFADGQAVDTLLRDCERASQQPWSAAPVISGKTRSGATVACVIPPMPRNRSAWSSMRTRPRWMRPSPKHWRPRKTGTRPAANNAPPCWNAPRSCSRNIPRLSPRAACARPERRCPTPSGKCARRWTSCAITRSARARFYPRGAAAGSHRRAQPAAPARQGGVWLHQPVEFSARDLHWPGGGGARRGNTVVAKPAEQTPLTALTRPHCCCRPGYRPQRCISCRATAQRSAPR